MRERWQEPHPLRLAPDRPDRAVVMAAHDAAVASGADGYHDPVTGWWVFTAVALAANGGCCEQGCRHCPWVGT